MPEIVENLALTQNLFGSPEAGELFRAIANPEASEGRAALALIAAKIGRSRRPGARSDIPAGATYLAQLVAHDLDFPRRHPGTGPVMLDLALIYGDGPKQDVSCYQAPQRPGVARHLLRLGRTRPTSASPAWGALRDLPRTSCPSLDTQPSDNRSEVLVPNDLSDSNLLLGQVQVLFALMHNAAASAFVETRGPETAFRVARGLTTRIYHDAIRNDLLGEWLMPQLRSRYCTDTPRRLATAVCRTPREFLAGVGRIGQGLVREIYTLKTATPIASLRDIARQTSTGRPHDMPLTEDWLLDFSRFFAIGSSVPQRARAIGPHVARPFASGLGASTDGSNESLVLRDLIACTRGGVRSVRSLISLAGGADPRIFEGCLAQDEAARQELVATWLADTGLAQAGIDRLAVDPPLTLYLMLEAELDTGGRTLGALGSVIMGETIAAALPPVEADAELLSAAATLFQGPVPTSMAELICFLQRHYRLTCGAQLHVSDDVPTATLAEVPGGSAMLDIHSATRQPISQIDVADHIELGRLVAQWATDPDTRPADIAELRQQLEGIAIIPEQTRRISFEQSSLDHLVLRLPVKEMVEESLDRLSDPLDNGRYRLPQFYADHYRPGFGPVMTSLDMLLARIGDGTFSQCR